MSKILLAEGFGNLTDGTHTVASEREIFGEQWPSVGANYVIDDIGDGRKWCKAPANYTNPAFASKSWTGETEIYFSCRIYRGDTGYSGVVYFYSGANTLGGIWIDTNGKVSYSNYPHTTIGIVAVSTASLPLDSITHIEVKVTFHNSTGAVRIWINGVEDSNTTGIDTINAGTSCTGVVLMKEDGRLLWKYTDFIVHNDTGPLGDVGVYYFPANADGAETDFTPSAGDNYQCLDDIGPDEDTTYNESDGTAGHRDTINTTNPTGLTIISVGALVRARKTDTGAATLLIGAKHSTNETQSAAKALSTDYLTLLEFIDDVPGGTGWTLTQVQDALVSYEVGA